MNKTAILNCQIRLFGKVTSYANGENRKIGNAQFIPLEEASERNIFFTLELTVRRTKHLITMTPQDKQNDSKSQCWYSRMGNLRL